MSFPRSAAFRRAAGPCAVVFAALILAGCGQSADTSGAASGSSPNGRNPDELVFAAVPSENAQSLQNDYKPLISMLEKETGKKIRFQSATSYSAVIEAQRTDKVDIAQYGPFSFITAQNSGVKATPVAAQTKAKGATPGYQSYGITRPGSGINSIADYRGKKVCFVDPDSTSGYLYPSAALLNAGIDPAKDITPVMTGGHDASALAVLHGQCDAGFAEDSMIDQTLPSKGQLKPGELNVIWKSDVIAGPPVVVSDDLDPDLKAKIAAAFQVKANIDYLNSSGACSTECKSADDSGDWGYSKVDNSFYDGVRKVCDITKAKQCNAQA
jgi:phosphonate transport system substrate-binding protein